MIIQEKSENCIYAVTVTKAGIKHMALEEPNQDSNAFLIMGSDMVMAVADGVGSCKKAEIASQNACSLCTEMFCDLVSRKDRASCEEIASMIINRWNAFLEGKNGIEYCTTLKAVFVVDGILSAVSIGDGLLMVALDGEAISSPVDGNDFLNQTDCLSPGISEESVWICQRSVDRKDYTVFMSTDGVSNYISAGREKDLINEISRIAGEETLKDELISFFNEIRLVSADDMTLGVIRCGR